MLKKEAQKGFSLLPGPLTNLYYHPLSSADNKCYGFERVNVSRQIHNTACDDFQCQQKSPLASYALLSSLALEKNLGRKVGSVEWYDAISVQKIKSHTRGVRSFNEGMTHVIRT